MKLNRGHALQLTLSPEKSVPAGFDFLDATGDTILALLLYFGFGGLVVSLFNLPVVGAVPAVLGVLIISCAFAFCHTTQRRMFGVAIIIICIIILWVLAAKFARAGLSLTMNSLSTAIDTEFLRINAQYNIDVSPSIYLACGTLFLTPFAALLALLCVFIVRRAVGLAGVAILIALTAVSVFEAVNHTGAWAALLGVATALLLCRMLAAFGHRVYGIGATMLSAGAVLIAGGIVGIIVLSLFPGDFSEKTAYLLQKNQRNILQTIHHMRYEKGTYTVLPEGDYAQISEPEYSYETVLKLTTDHPDSIYLRGYIGEVYTDFGWEPIDKKVMHNYTGLFYQLHENGFYPQTQLANLVTILDADISEDETVILKVENSAACRGYIYAPYELIGAEDALLPPDNLMESHLISGGLFGQTDYELTVLPNQVKRHNQLAQMLEQQQSNPSAALRNYLEQEGKYRNFVYEQYTAISPEDSILLTRYIGDAGIAGQTHVAYKDAKNNILAILTRHLDDSYDNAAFDGDGSFVQFIMGENQSASSVGYASIAVMMLRHYGIPARYVEGYLITPDDVDALSEGEEIELLDSNAHAWAEYYHDGLGWIPFEADPNYIGVMEGINDPPSYAQGGTDGTQEEEPELPEHKHRDRDEESDGFIDRLIAVIRFLLPWLLFIMALAALVGLWLFYRIKRIEKRKKACEQKDNNAAVFHMMIYILQLLKAVGIAEPTNAPIKLKPEIEKVFGTDIGENFGFSVAVYLKAVFSHHHLSQDERHVVSALMQQIIAQIEQTQPRKKQFIIRYLKCLY